MLIVIEIGMDRKCRLRPKDQVDTLATISSAAHVSNKISFRPRASLYQVYSSIYIDILVIRVALMVGRMISRITYFTLLLFTSAIEISITVILLIIIFYAIAIRKGIKLYRKLDIQLFLGFSCKCFNSLQNCNKKKI